MNVIVGLMLVGTATDYALYMLRRYDESSDEFAEHAWRPDGRWCLGALRSIVGFVPFAIPHAIPALARSATR